MRLIGLAVVRRRYVSSQPGAGGTRGVAWAVLAALVATALSPAWGEAQYSRARAEALGNAHDTNGLLAYLKAWTDAEPKNDEPWYLLGATYGSKHYQLGLQRPKDAYTALHRAVALNPHRPESWHVLGMITPELGLWDECVDALKHAVAEAPSRINYHTSLAACHSHQRQFPSALQALGSAEPYARTEQDWLQISNSYTQVGAASAEQEAFKRAEAADRKALQLNPRNGSTWTSLGNALAAQGQGRSAFDAYLQGSRLGDKTAAQYYQQLQSDLQYCQNFSRSPSVDIATLEVYNRICSKFFNSGYGLTHYHVERKP
jgi:cytochrome c-type biogenesis protein CcmH/NrfG